MFFVFDETPNMAGERRAHPIAPRLKLPQKSDEISFLLRR